jgi:peptidoglycan/xylan/chitin deacetylase (PgdA/CDA1 family)
MSAVKSVIQRLLVASPLPAALRRRTRRQVLVLMFHGFADRGLGEIENYDGKFVFRSDFDELLRYLTRHYTVVSLDEAVAGLADGGELPPNPAVLTVDDGYRSTFTIAYPLLQKYRAPATVYLATAFLEREEFLWHDRLAYAFDLTERRHLDWSADGGGRQLPLTTAVERVAALEAVKQDLKTCRQEDLGSAVERLEEHLGAKLGRQDCPDLYEGLAWDEIREMSADGLVDCGAHTHTHVILGRCGPDRIREEVAASTAIIEARAGARPRHFCYPNGAVGDFNAESERVIRKHGFVSAVTTLRGFNKRGCDPFRLRRRGIPGGLGRDYCVLDLCGFLSLWHGEPGPAGPSGTPTDDMRHNVEAT